MKILFCIDGMTKGGAERVISNLSNYLIKGDNEVEILTVFKSEIEYNLDSNINISSLENNYIDLHKPNKKRGNISKLFMFIKRANIMKKKLKKINPDIIISFLPYTSFLVLKNANKIKKPIIVSVRNDPKEEYKSKVYNLFMRKLYPKASGFVFQTEDAKEYFKDIISVKTKIIPNPLNPLFMDVYKGKRKKEIVSVGRLCTQKNHKMLIEAFSKIHNKYPDYKLIIYGEGDLRESLENLIKEKHLENRSFLPGIENDIKSKIYNSSLFILSSNYEGMPNALMEAMALGLPVISTDCPCGGPKFLIDKGKNGILVKVGDIDDLANKMEMILENETFAGKLGESASKISEKLNPSKINNEWYEFIKLIAK